MSDLEEIERVINAYARNIDGRTPENFAAEVFAPDANVDTGFGLFIGVDEVIREYRVEMEKFEATVHMNSNFEIDIDGDTASGTTNVAFWHWRKADVVKMEVYLGAYIDRFVRLPEGWRIVHRRFRMFGPPD